MPLAVKKVPTSLTAILEAAEGQVTAICPELDLAVAADTAEQALDDLVDAAIEYADEYMAELPLYSGSPNRAHHLDHVRRIQSAVSRDAVRGLFLS